MKSKLIFLLKYFLFWIFLFEFYRLVFILYHIREFESIRFIDYFLILVYGLKLDISLTGYILIVPTLCFILFSWFRNNISFYTIRAYTIILIPLISLFYIIDLELYNYWHYRLDKSFLDYINTPREMLANLKWYHYNILIISLTGTYLLSYEIIYKKLLKNKKPFDNIGDWKSPLVFVIILASLILPIRGGFSTSPVNVGAVYFHKDNIVNHSAINPVWNLIYSLTESEKTRNNVKFFDYLTEQKILKNIEIKTDNTKKVLITDRPNIIIVILESFTASIIKETGGLDYVTPNFNRLIKEGIFFNNFYASGWSSNRGIGAIIAGYPALPKSCILSYEKKVESLPGISKDLADLGYISRFYYGGDIDFAHIRSFLVSNKFDDIISHIDFKSSDYYSKWGVPDHKVFNRLLLESNDSDKPFFHVFFTLSSHEPYEVPMKTVIEGNNDKDAFFNSAYYTDQAIGNFIDSIKTTEWWDSTLIILVADHGARIERMTTFDKKRFHIPMLWLGGALNIKDTIITRLGSQTDIPATLLNQLNISADNYIFSKDLFNKDSMNYVSYIYPYGITYITDSAFVAYDLTASKFIKEEGNFTDMDENISKALLQNLLDDFSKR